MNKQFLQLTSALLVSTPSLLTAQNQTPSEKLRIAHQDVVDGRAFRRDIFTSPSSNKTSIIASFRGGLDGTKTGASTQLDKLRSGIAEAQEIQQDSDSGSPYLNTGGQSQSTTVSEMAGTLEMEALEAAQYGLLAIGNRDLIDGTRLEFPGAGGVVEPAYRQEAPARTADDFVGVSGATYEKIYGSPFRQSLRSLEYARHFYLEGIIDTLDVLRQRPDKKLRTIDPNYGDQRAGWTRWDQPEALPALDDTELDNGDTWSLTAGAQAGKLLRRYGGTVVTQSDKLWRRAYRHSSPGAAATEPTSGEYLNEAVMNLNCGMHAQYLASLALAGSMTDIRSSGESEFVKANVQDVVSSVGTAQNLIDKIESGLRPRTIPLVRKWDDAEITGLVERLNSLAALVASAYANMQTKISEDRSGSESLLRERQNRREGLQYQLWQITGIHPDENPDVNGDPLDTPEERSSYVSLVEAEIQRLVAINDPSDPKFRQGLPNRNDPLSSVDVFDAQGGITSTLDLGTPNSHTDNTSQLAFSSLNLARSIVRLRQQVIAINQIAEKVAIAEEKTERSNRINRDSQIALGAIEATIALASSVKTEATVFGIGVSTDFGKIIEATTAIARRTIDAVAKAQLNGVDLDATVANFLLEQDALIEGIDERGIDIREATLSIRSQLAQVQQLVGDYAYYVDVLGGTDQWYFDPELIFGREASEIRYEQLVRSYQQLSYILAKHVEEARLEPFEVPVKNLSGIYTSAPYNDIDGAANFPDAEAVFVGIDHLKVKTFLNTLQTWDATLSNDSFRGSSNLRSSINKVSVRRDLFGLVDYRWDELQQRFVADSALKNQSIRDFRAIMSEAVSSGQSFGKAFRLDFPLDISLQNRVEGSDRLEPIFEQMNSSQEWNRRIRQVGMAIEGSNVTQGTPANSDGVIGFLMQTGTIRRRSAPLPSASFVDSVWKPVDLIKYQFDPSDEFGSQIFRTDLELQIGNGSAGAIEFNGDSFNGTIVDIDWPFNCSAWTLILEEGGARINFDNIEDIRLELNYEWGAPDPLLGGLNLN